MDRKQVFLRTPMPCRPNPGDRPLYLYPEEEEAGTEWQMEFAIAIPCIFFFLLERKFKSCIFKLC